MEAEAVGLRSAAKYVHSGLSRAVSARRPGKPCPGMGSYDSDGRLRPWADLITMGVLAEVISNSTARWVSLIVVACAGVACVRTTRIS